MYEFNWEGKELAYELAQTPSTGTLRPDKGSSKNWDDTENLYIEGDNLEVLKLLQKSYFGKVKMIYIDPPYNTGKDFVYHDDFRDNIANYKEVTNQNTKANPETNGRYHTDWLNMMYSRLKLARNLLKEDGFIFISINDYEVDNLKKICNEIFGENNFIANYIWLKGKEGGNDSLGIGIHHEYILMYAKNMELACSTINLDKKDISRHITKDKEYNLVKGIVNNSREGELYQYINLTKQKDYKVRIPLNDGTILESYSYAPQSTIDRYIAEGKVFVGSKKTAYIKSYLNDEKKGSKPSSIIESIYGTTKAGSIEIREIMGDKDIFSYAKPSKLIKRIIEIGSGNDDIILDFFSGSSSTAHSTIQLNLEDNKDRKFIMVQLPEKIDEKSEAYKAGYKNICEIGKERIRRAGDKIVSENKDKEGIENLDIGFKVFKLGYNKEGDKMYNEKLTNLIKIEILESKKPKELKGKKKIATINKDADYKVQVFIDDDYNLYYQDNHAFASCESKIVDNKVVTTWNSCKCWFKITGLYECRNNHIVDILRDLNSYSEYLYPKNNVADNMMLSRLYEQMINVYLDYVK